MVTLSISEPFTLLIRNGCSSAIGWSGGLRPSVRPSVRLSVCSYFLFEAFFFLSLSLFLFLPWDNNLRDRELTYVQSPHVHVVGWMDELTVWPLDHTQKPFKEMDRVSKHCLHHTTYFIQSRYISEDILRTYVQAGRSVCPMNEFAWGRTRRRRRISQMWHFSFRCELPTLHGHHRRDSSRWSRKFLKCVNTVYVRGRVGFFDHLGQFVPKSHLGLWYTVSQT